VKQKEKRKWNRRKRESTDHCSCHRSSYNIIHKNMKFY